MGGTRINMFSLLPTDRLSNNNMFFRVQLVPPPTHTHSNTHLPFMCESMQEIDCDGPHFLLFFRLTAS